MRRKITANKQQHTTKQAQQEEDVEPPAESHQSELKTNNHRRLTKTVSKKHFAKTTLSTTGPQKKKKFHNLPARKQPTGPKKPIGPKKYFTGPKNNKPLFSFGLVSSFRPRLPIDHLLFFVETKKEWQNQRAKNVKSRFSHSLTLSLLDVEVLSTVLAQDHFCSVSCLPISHIDTP